MKPLDLVTDAWRILTFRKPRHSIPEHRVSFLLFGLVCTWLAGLGRYWDHPHALSWQSAGIGSVIYVFVLALLLWIFTLPFRSPVTGYGNVLTLVVLTSPLAWLYALPVERWFDRATAINLNLGFLAAVALWRVLLYAHFLRSHAKFSWVRVVVLTLLPLGFAVMALSVLNLEHAVIEVMAGIGREPEPPGQEEYRYMVTLVIGVLSMFATPVLLVVFAILVWKNRPKRTWLEK